MEIGKIIERLESLGYEYRESDEYAVKFTISKVEQHIQNKINCDELPNGLLLVAIDTVCAEFLSLQKSLGLLTDKVFERVANNIKMGDTDISFPAEATPEQKFDIAMNSLKECKEDDFVRFRKLVW